MDQSEAEEFACAFAARNDTHVNANVVDSLSDDDELPTYDDAVEVNNNNSTSTFDYNHSDHRCTYQLAKRLPQTAGKDRHGQASLRN
jgi:LmbE family N-acetylglucosaminyl deacetylase